MKLFNQKKLAIFLIGLGVLPYIICLLLLVLQIHPEFMPVSLQVLIHSYSVVICCFIAGLQWGIHLSKRTQNSVYLFSSFIALVMWASLLVLGSTLGLVISTLAISALLLIEYAFSRERVTTPWFWVMRRAVSIIAIFCMLMTLLLTA